MPSDKFRPYQYMRERNLFSESDKANMKRFLGDIIPEEGGEGTPQPATPAPDGSPKEPSNQLPQPEKRADGGSGTPQPATPVPPSTPSDPEHQLPQPELRSDGGPGTPQPSTPTEAVEINKTQYNSSKAKLLIKDIITQSVITIALNDVNARKKSHEKLVGLTTELKKYLNIK